MLRIRTPTERPQPGIAARTFFNCTTELLKLAARKATNGPASAGVDSPWCDNPPRWERQDASAFSSSVQRAVIRRRAEMLRVRGASQRVRVALPMQTLWLGIGRGRHERVKSAASGGRAFGTDAAGHNSRLMGCEMKHYPAVAGGKEPRPLRMVAGAIAMVLVIGTIDYITGSQVSIAPLYLVPIAVATWFVSLHAGLLLLRSVSGGFDFRTFG